MTAEARKAPDGAVVRGQRLGRVEPGVHQRLRDARLQRRVRLAETTERRTGEPKLLPRGDVMVCVCAVHDTPYVLQT